MGCDIHLYVEKKDEQGQWKAMKGINPWIAEYKTWAEGSFAKGDTSRAEHLTQSYKKMQRQGKVLDWAYNGRNYSLFAILADVRNGEDIVPIDDARGLPMNVSNEVQKAADRWDGDGHSQSWFTVKELKEYDWEQETHSWGWVSEEVYKQWKAGGSPYPCSGTIGGGGVVHVGNEEMDDLIAGTYPREEGKTYFTRIEWGEKYSEAAGEFYTETIPKLEAISEDGIGNDIRIVFWFDN